MISYAMMILGEDENDQLNPVDLRIEKTVSKVFIYTESSSRSQLPGHTLSPAGFNSVFKNKRRCLVIAGM